jgi:hypothetical protein
MLATKITGAGGGGEGGGAGGVVTTSQLVHNVFFVLRAAPYRSLKYTVRMAGVLLQEEG